MTSEHCHKDGCDHEFTSGNYQVTTTPQREWRVAVDGRADLADLRHGRILTPVEALMRLELVSSSGLTRAEVIAVVLYTGPMVRAARPFRRAPPRPAPLTGSARSSRCTTPSSDAFPRRSSRPFGATSSPPRSTSWSPPCRRSAAPPASPTACRCTGAWAGA